MDLSVEDAQAIVDDIRVLNGGLRAEAEQALPDETRRALRNLQQIAGQSIVHVAQDLYDKDTRFIYELIQNAEDNRYRQAINAQEEPFLQFTLSPDCITVDSNEDGFSEDDVRAICSIHRSSKRQTAGYIGHKGIGFKSVFKIARKVIIQSGPFCFSFSHRQGEPGMGMITPYNEAHETLPAAVRTRITLQLISPTDFAARASEFQEIPDTLLLFLRQLRNITLVVVPNNQRTSYKRLQDPSGQHVTLAKETDGQQHQKHYLFEQSTVSDLPEHPSRPGSKEADLILAFPVDEHSCPVIEPQYVYSFLPMRHEGFNFLIQSDFITQANRLGVHLCPRNYALRQGICDLFVQAIVSLSRESPLKYDWLQYLPGPSIHDPFWCELREMIIDSLKESKVLLTRRETLKQGKSLQHLSSRHCDRHGEPLFEDLESEVYLSASYNWSRDADILMELGVTNLSYATILDRLEPYLDGDFPKYLHASLDADWHTRVAKLLLRALKRDGRSSTITERLKELPLVPTTRHKLVSPATYYVYFPDDEQGHAIPGDLTDLRIVESSALASAPRRELVEALGAEHCKSDVVVKSILKRYNRHDGVTLQQSVSHLGYLFRVAQGEDGLDKRVFIMDEDEQRVYRAFVTLGVDIITEDLYFDTMGEYGTRALSDTLSGSGVSGDTPSYKLRIIHGAYLDAVPIGTIANGRTWEQWLEEAANVRRVPRLKSRRGENLSPLFQHLARHHPIMLLGLLKTHISAYEPQFTDVVQESIGDMLVPCKNNFTQELQCTYFPSEELTQICSVATVATLFDGFLNISLVSDSTDVQEWEFLGMFGVTLKPEIGFFVDVFDCLLKKDTSLPGETQDAYFNLYKEVFLRFPERDELMEEIFDEDNDNKAVYVPARPGQPEKVVYLSDCVWEGHPFLQTKVPLAIHERYRDDPFAVGLFRDRLLLPDAHLRTYLGELQWRKDGLDVPKDDVGEIYRAIFELIREPEDRGLVQNAFNAHNLVFLNGEQEWVAPTSCVWTDAEKVGVKHGVGAEYSGLEEFFCDILSIPAPNAANYIEQLRALVSCHPADLDLVKVKESIGQINALAPMADEIQALRGLSFLPVRMPGDDVQLLSVADTFFIADRVEYLSSFRGRVPILDYSLEECRRLHLLLELLGLEDRNMSAAVQEQTFVDQPSREGSLRPTREFRRKAGAIYRCILHYNGDEPMDSLSKLQSAIVHESEGFRKSLLLQLNDVRAEVQSDRGLTHIEVIDDILRVYIPRTPEERQRCYSLDLPRALQRHFGVQSPEAELKLQLVFLSPEALVDQLLDGCGVVGIPRDILQLISESDTGVETQIEGQDESDTEQLGLNTRRDDRFNQERLAMARQSAEPAARPFPVQPDQAPDLSPYSGILENVMRIARQHTLPEMLDGTPNYAHGITGINHRDAFGSRSQRQVEHDIKIGAAGELFVFELLLGAELPGFSRTNWRSTIRTRVSVHPDYYDLAAWNGAETADIVYEDTSASLTSLLANAGLLGGEMVGANPRYYIEVKTTTGECESAFYMSRAQYRRMERMHLEHGYADQVNPEVYVIFRVHHLGQRNMGLQVYVDPESLRRDGRLVFQSESYSVRPGVLS
ncbi:hypothetical protein BDV18DRAFT_160118 [Aspergillus unguis]